MDHQYHMRMIKVGIDTYIVYIITLIIIICHLLCIDLFCSISEYITFKAVWKKNNYDITFPVDDKIAKLKAHIQTLTGLYNSLHIEISNIINK